MIAGSIIHTYGCMCVKQSLCGMRRLMQPCKVKSVGFFVVVLTQLGTFALRGSVCPLLSEIFS